jgi:MFS transporter, MHS family, proline/betaine transporter
MKYYAEMKRERGIKEGIPMKVERRSIFISLLSNLFHYYAFSVYAFSAVILAPIFFPTENGELTKILGLFTFGITFLLKPLGSIVFGHIGDKYGRKMALTQSLVVITIATTCIGLIPSYAQIGWLSSFFLLLCLLAQGLCIGGQYTGAIVYIQEHTKKENAAFACGVVGALGVFGTLLGTATSYLFDYFGALAGGTWRIPFLLTSVMGFSLYFLMKKMQETPSFIENKSHAQKKDLPLMSIVRNYKKILFSAVCISSISISMFYIATVYVPNFYIDSNETGNILSSLGLVCLGQLLCVVLMPLLGSLSDRLGREKQLKLTSALLIVSPIFIFYFMTVLNTFSVILIGVFLFSFCASLYAGPGPAYLSEKFPVVGRYSGMGLGITIGEGIFGGLTPIICVGFQQFFSSKIAPAYFIIFLGVLSLVGISLARKVSLSEEEELGGDEKKLPYRYTKNNYSLT